MTPKKQEENVFFFFGALCDLVEDDKSHTFFLNSICTKYLKKNI